MEYIPALCAFWYNDKCMDRIVHTQKSKLTAVPYTLRARSWFSKETTIAQKKGGKRCWRGESVSEKCRKSRKARFSPRKEQHVKVPVLWSFFR